MTETENKNLVYQLGVAAMRAIKKHQKENIIAPSSEEYLACLHEAVKQVELSVNAPKRKPGRPKKVKTVDDLNKNEGA